MIDNTFFLEIRFLKEYLYQKEKEAKTGLEIAFAGSLFCPKVEIDRVYL